MKYCEECCDDVEVDYLGDHICYRCNPTFDEDAEELQELNFEDD